MDAEMDNIFIARQQREASKRNWILMSLLGVVTLVVGIFAGSAMTAKGWSPFKSSNQVPIYVAADNRGTQPLTLNGGFSAIAKAVTPAVVTIEVKSRARQQQLPFMMDPFHDFFNSPDQDDETPTPRRRTPQNRDNRKGPLVPSGLGSGVIVSPDGYILTNNHVVEDADKVEVKLTDGREFVAKVIGTDAPSDVAVVKIDATGLPTLPLGDSDKAEIGDIVLAVGNPLGVGQTVTMGIISAKGRSTGTRAVGGIAAYEDFIQTDAPINRGNSGGALVNLNGELIGIPSQILSATGGSIGIGFAIPTKMARNVMDQLIKGGRVRRGILGVNLNPQGLTSEVAEQLGYKGTKGALVTIVNPGSPAEKAGVKPGDIITEFQGQQVQNNDHLRNMVSQTAPGTSVRFRIWRGNSERELTAVLDEFKPEELAGNTTPQEGGAGSDSGSNVLSGVRVENLTAEKARLMNIPSAVRGVLVAEVDQDSTAAEAGLRQGMIIEEVNRQAVSTVADFNEALKKIGNKKVLLRVRTRAGGATYIVINPQE
ncbi:MAG TPA: DegQ family serine endoprotease [Blastocatellia bacterium]|nr:DegQ family serine endoprotease [Blastocatellia bacterium]